MLPVSRLSSLFTFLLLAPVAHAHDPGISSSVVTVRPDGIDVTVRLHDDEPGRSIRFGPTSPPLIVGEEDGARTTIERHVTGDHVELRYRLERPPGDRLSIRAPFLATQDHGHRHLVTVRGELFADLLLAAKRPGAMLPHCSSTPMNLAGQKVAAWMASMAGTPNSFTQTSSSCQVLWQ